MDIVRRFTVVYSDAVSIGVEIHFNHGVEGHVGDAKIGGKSALLFNDKR